MSPTDPPRLLWIDVLRVGSTFAVVVLHAAAGAMSRASDTGSPSWWAANVTDSCVRWSVPVFVLISGALLLDPAKPEGPAAFLKRRLTRILTPLVVWSIALLLLRVLLEPSITARDIARAVLEGRPYGHLWYLYMVLGLYLFTPFLRTYVRHSSSAERGWLILVLLLVSSGASMLDYVYGSAGWMTWVLFPRYLGYYLCGHQLRRADPAAISTGWVLLLLGSAALVTVLGTYVLVNLVGPLRGLALYDFLSPSVIVMSLAVFVSVRRLVPAGDPPATFTGRMIGRLAPATLGVYLVQYPMLHLLARAGVTSDLINPWLGIPSISILVFVSSYAVVAVMLKVPYLRRAVG